MADTINDDVERALKAYGGDNFTYRTFGTFSIRPRVRVVTPPAPIPEPQPEPEPLILRAEHAVAAADVAHAMVEGPAAEWEGELSQAAEAVQFQPAPPASGDWDAPAPRYAPAPVPNYAPSPGRFLHADHARALQGDPAGRLPPPRSLADRWAAGTDAGAGAPAGRSQPLAERFAQQAARAGEPAGGMNIFQMAWETADAARPGATPRPKAEPGAPEPLPGDQDLFRRL